MKLETIIGLEVHVQLNTKTKLFCSCDNDAFGAEPNTRVCPICMAFPGMLPVLNQKALDKSVKAALALGCEIKLFSKFDRKNYFYPDLPSGYQISQFDQPVSENGMVEILVDGEYRNIGITRAHIENDAGKLTHTATGTLCDYNRAGTPLIEIVTEPDLRSPLEAQILAKEIQKIVRFVGASTADMEKGMMRFDASISLRPVGEKKLYPRTEIKNLNSFASLQKALNYELKKQTKLWAKNEAPDGDTTVGWLDDEGKTYLMRSKESAMDYRYFPEPDLPPITFEAAEIEAVKATIPELPLAKYKRYQSALGLTEQEALKLSEAPELASFFEATVELAGEDLGRKVANLILVVVLVETYWKKTLITPTHIADTLALQSSGKISASAAKEIVAEAMKTGDSAESIMNDKGLAQKSDTGAIETWVTEVIANNAAVVADIQSGKNPKMIQFLMGQIMKQSKGSANPGIVMKMLKEKLEG